MWIIPQNINSNFLCYVTAPKGIRVNEYNQRLNWKKDMKVNHRHILQSLYSLQRDL